MTTIPHPYRGQINRHEARVSCDVSKEDFDFLFRETLPLRNSQNSVIATLFHKLVQELRRHHANKLTPFDIDNERVVQQCLQRLTFAQPHDNGSDKAVRRRAKAVRGEDKRASG